LRLDSPTASSTSNVLKVIVLFLFCQSAAAARQALANPTR
jgi:hypothetical protein